MNSEGSGESAHLHRLTLVFATIPAPVCCSHLWFCHNYQCDGAYHAYNRNLTEIVILPCLVLIDWTDRECLHELVRLSIRCALALVCWFICFLWEVTNRFHFYITKFCHCWSSNEQWASLGGYFIIIFFICRLVPGIYCLPIKKIWNIKRRPTPKNISWN